MGSARLADGISRNCGNRDELMEARTQDLFDRQGRVRTFDLAKYLSDCEVRDSLQPWAVGEDGYIGKDADVAALLAVVEGEREAGHKSDYWKVLPGRSSCIGGRRSGPDFLVLRVHVQPRTALFRPDLLPLPESGLEFERERICDLQFSDGASH